MLHVIQSEARVPLGAYESFLVQHDIPFRIVRLYANDSLPAAAEVQALLVLGGTMGVHETDRFPWMAPLQQLMRKVAEDGTPLLGICLGGQLLAAALDGKVTANSHGERGVHQVDFTAAGKCDPLFAGLPDPLPAMQWHNDSFNLAPGAVALASSAACPVQAFRVAHAYGLQFHPEVNVAVVTDWSRKEPEAEEVTAVFAAAFASYNAVWQRLFANFLQLAGLLPAAN